MSEGGGGVDLTMWCGKTGDRKQFFSSISQNLLSLRLDNVKVPRAILISSNYIAYMSTNDKS